MNQDQKEELKHCKDCLKVLQQPQMVGLVNDLELIIAKYKSRIDEINNFDRELELGKQRQKLIEEGYKPCTEEDLKKTVDNF